MGRPTVETPAVRGSSRLLAALPGEPLRDVQFADLPQWLQPGDVMVFNNTKVMKARERQHFDIALKVKKLIEQTLVVVKKAKDDKLTPEQAEKAERRAEKARRSFQNRFRMSGELGYRGNENLTSSKLVYTVVGFRYRLHKYARLTLEHRYSFRDKYTNNTHRIDTQLDSDKDFGRLNVGYRGVFQHEFTLPIRYRDILRHRAQLTYRTKNWPIDPYVSTETFSTFHYTGSKLIDIRYGVGAQWTLDNDHVVDLSVRYDREQNITDMQYRWIFGVAYEFKWRK